MSGPYSRRVRPMFSLFFAGSGHGPSGCTDINECALPSKPSVFVLLRPSSLESSECCALGFSVWLSLDLFVWSCFLVLPSMPRNGWFSLLNVLFDLSICDCGLVPVCFVCSVCRCVSIRQIACLRLQTRARRARRAPTRSAATSAAPPSVRCLVCCAVVLTRMLPLFFMPMCCVLCCALLWFAVCACRCCAVQFVARDPLMRSDPFLSHVCCGLCVARRSSQLTSLLCFCCSFRPMPAGLQRKPVHGLHRHQRGARCVSVVAMS